MNLEIYDTDIKLVDALKNDKLSSIILSENKLRFFQNERLKTFRSPYKNLGSIQLGAATNKNNKLFVNVIKDISILGLLTGISLKTLLRNIKEYKGGSFKIN